ncbi:Outer membrane cobalamin receptor protein [Chryseobacterium nakagawai]|uniref:SusC/RagA family TonB-linked outer membrane protein n=1 Tax=Chryseobacterium nakagawai TaxID=1241982 RepID=A0AAD1DQZ4_CHRNA|nr:SusC/RagA family TonB-linked outer membrane protein [Chryseobacterium nakagawai]AZA91892.1 SusC/RagA family TonB-linked outer membrane protein [Chryseobacterium nakagawai]VEH18411.1 Outer membrane cobalamin receptor protein [Chryseobacterium nakagawai]
MRKAVIPVLFVFSLSATAQEKKAADTTKTTDIQEVVVTSLGVKRQARALTYSSQQIGGDELTEVKTPNFLNSISGKVSNVQINRTNGVGSSVRVLMRGNKSANSSQPLYVIDGIPIINSVGKSAEASQYSTMPDAGDVLSSINPDDIESINFLKGASASALYGSIGGNGVILITTKKGKAGKSSISYNTSFTVDQAYSLPKLQHSYLSYDPSVSGQTPGVSNESWGAKGASKDYLKDFLQTGTTWVNSLSFQSGTEKSTNYFSIGNTTNKGIVPSSYFDQYNVSFRNSSKYLNDKLTLDANFIGSLQNSINRQTPGVSFSPLVSLYWLPRGVDFDQYNNSNYYYIDKSRLLPGQNWWAIGPDGKFNGNPATQNPYWILNRDKVTVNNKNTYSAISLAYQINPWLSARVRGNYSWNITDSQRGVSAYSDPILITSNGENGRFLQNKYENSSTYGDVLLVGSPKLSEDISLDFTVGGSINTSRNTVTEIDNAYLAIPNLFTLSNLQWNVDRGVGDGFHNISYSTKKQIQSVFASASLGYKNMFFVDMTFRNDWDSTLAYTGTSGYDYESVGANAVLSSIFKLPEAISFWKIRGSYATVGLGLPANLTTAMIPYNSVYGYNVDAGQIVKPKYSLVTNPAYKELFVKPELNKTFEAGTELRLFKNRLSFDITYYNSNASNQLLPLNIDSNLGGLPSGSYYINAGKIQNTGFEASLSYKIFDSEKFGWTANLNGSANKNKIVELFPSRLSGLENQLLALTGGGIYTKLKLGGSFGDIYGVKFLRDDQGRILVDADGKPMADKQIGYLGNPNPKFMLGFNNSFNIGKLGISFLIDGKFGGQVLSLTEKANDLLGVSQNSASARDAGGVAIPNAVYAPGTPNAGTAYTGLTDAKAYYKAVGANQEGAGIDEAYIYSATTVRLRQASIGYTFDIKSSYLKNATVSIVGTNLFFFYKKAPFDPEQVSGNTPGGVGVDSFGIPITRSIGLSLKANF